MDRFHENMARWILVTSVVVVMAMLGVLAHFWWNRPTSPPIPRRGTGPILVNEPDGSVYDLTLKLSLLEERLMREEQRSKDQSAENTTLRRDNERLTRELRELTQEVGRLRRQIPRPAPAPAPDREPAPPPATPTPTPDPAPPP